MSADTDIGGGEDVFPETHLSAIIAAADAAPQVRQAALSRLIDGYWKPAYKHIRRRWQADNERAKDLTQGFFASAIERGLFSRYEPERAAFRTYLRMCIDGYVSNERTAAHREKRGGGQPVLSLDFAAAEAELAQQGAAGADPAADFEQDWVRTVFARAVDTLGAQCVAAGRERCLRVFERYDLHADESAARPTYDALAQEFGVPATTITNDLHAARRQFRELVLAALRELTGSAAEYREEARRLLGVAIL